MKLPVIHMLGTDSRRYRIFMLVFMFLLGLTILGVRLCLLYGWYGSSLVEQSEKNYTKINEIKPIRGSLVDVQGRPLATNEILFDLYWSGSESRMYEQSDLKRDYEIIKKIGSEVSYEHLLQAYKKKTDSIDLKTYIRFFFRNWRSYWRIFLYYC